MSLKDERKRDLSSSEIIYFSRTHLFLLHLQLRLP